MYFMDKNLSTPGGHYRGHLEGTDTGRALRVVEQDVMDQMGNVPRSENSLNKIRALTEKKRDLYRPLLDKE